MEVVDYTVVYIYGRQRKGAHEWMIEFKILPQMYHNPESTR
jgi:hypothetical protein